MNKLITYIRKYFIYLKVLLFLFRYKHLFFRIKSVYDVPYILNDEKALLLYNIEPFYKSLKTFKYNKVYFGGINKFFYLEYCEKQELLNKIKKFTKK